MISLPVLIEKPLIGRSISVSILVEAEVSIGMSMLSGSELKLMNEVRCLENLQVALERAKALAADLKGSESDTTTEEIWQEMYFAIHLLSEYERQKNLSG